MESKNLFDVSFTLSGEDDEQRHKFIEWMSDLDQKDYEVGIYEEETFVQVDPDDLFDTASETDEEGDRVFVFVISKIFETNDEDEAEELREETVNWLEERDPENGWEVNWSSESE